MDQKKGRGAYDAAATFIVRAINIVACISGLVIGIAIAEAQSLSPKSLKDVAVVEPPNLSDFVADKNAAIALGKALFWDMQVGSDGVQACASCHFQAGTDPRRKNQLSTGLNDLNFPDGSRVFGDPIPIYPSGDVFFGNSTIKHVDGHPGFSANYTIVSGDFPLHQRNPPTKKVPRPMPPNFAPVPPGLEFLSVVTDTNDVMSSQGVRLSNFLSIVAGSPFDRVAPLLDPVFNTDQTTVRRVEPRNAANVINAAFSFDLFWDGRASSVFNGVNPFGFRDRQSRLMKLNRNILEPVFVRIPFSALASQAVGPPVSSFEMSAAGRNFPLLGRKLLSLTPLGRQVVHPEDSVLGSLARAQYTARGRSLTTDTGLNTTYKNLIQKAFKVEWWRSAQIIEVLPGTESFVKASAGNPRSFVASPGEAVVMPTGNGSQIPKLDNNHFSQIEWNFSLFFGLAIQLYEATLIADDTPFDQFAGANSDVRRGGGSVPPNPNALTIEEKLGLDILRGTNISGLNPNLVDGKCHFCHTAPEFTSHSVRNLSVDSNGVPQKIIEVMIMGNGESAFYDNGTYNIAVRRTNEDIGRDATAPSAPPFINPLTNEPFPLSYAKMALLKRDGLLPSDVALFIPDMPQPCSSAGLFTNPDTGQCDVLSPKNDRVATKGAFKVPSTRGSRFTGPYFHSGGMATIRQVVEFYARGGNFPATNFDDFDPDIEGIPALDVTRDPDAEKRIQAVVEFFANGLTDERVKYEKAPFDHPQIFVPNGARDTNSSLDDFIVVPPVGKNGASIELGTFLDLDPQEP